MVSFDVRREGYESEMALLSGKCPRMQKQSLIHVSHSKRQFLPLFIFVSFSLLNYRVLTLHRKRQHCVFHTYFI